MSIPTSTTLRAIARAASNLELAAVAAAGLEEPDMEEMVTRVQEWSRVMERALEDNGGELRTLMDAVHLGPVSSLIPPGLEAGFHLEPPGPPPRPFHEEIIEAMTPWLERAIASRTPAPPRFIVGAPDIVNASGVVGFRVEPVTGGGATFRLLAVGCPDEFELARNANRNRLTDLALSITTWMQTAESSLLYQVQAP